MASREVARTLRALKDVLESTAETRQVLREVENTYRRFQGRIEKGASVEDAFAGLQIPEIRRKADDRFADLERARRQARRAIIAQGLAEKLSLGRLARLWGVSRQLVSRMAKEDS